MAKRKTKFDEVFAVAHESAVRTANAARNIRLAGQRLERYSWAAAVIGEDMLQSAPQRLKQLRRCIGELGYNFGVLSAMYEETKNEPHAAKRPSVHKKAKRAATRATRRRAVRHRA